MITCGVHGSGGATRPRRGGSEQGFTLLELVVAMGLLAGFLVMLVRLLATGASLFDEGERGQDLLDRAQAAARATQTALGETCGPRLIGRPGAEPDARLLVHHAPLGAVDGAPAIQVLRSTVRLSPMREEVLLREAFVAIARLDGADEQEALEIAGQRLKTWPRSGRGEMILLPWPADPEGAYLDLRRGDRPDDPLLVPAEALTLTAIDDPLDLGLTAESVLATTRVVATGLLHFELSFWSQRTLQWGDRGTRGPEVSWDSARAGLLFGEREVAEDFRLDLGPGSLRDARDDIWPRWVRVTMVIGRSPQSPPESFLAGAISEAETSIRVTRPEELPDPSANPFAKIGPEWIRFQGVSGQTLTGVRRGQRGTLAIAHASGVAIRVGRLVVIDVPLAHGRDGDD